MTSVFNIRKAQHFLHYITQLVNAEPVLKLKLPSSKASVLRLSFKLSSILFTQQNLILRAHMNVLSAQTKLFFPNKWKFPWKKVRLKDINAYVWNLERWYWWNYLQGSNEDTDIENILRETAGRGEEGKGGIYGQSNMETYLTICKIHS